MTLRVPGGGMGMASPARAAPPDRSPDNNKTGMWCQDFVADIIPKSPCKGKSKAMRLPFCTVGAVA